MGILERKGRRSFFPKYCRVFWVKKFCFEKTGKFAGRGGTRSCEARFPSPHPTPPGTPLCYALEKVNLSAQPDATNIASYRHLPIHYSIPQRRTVTCPERGSARGKNGLRNSECLSPSQTCPRPSVPPKGKEPHCPSVPLKSNHLSEDTDTGPPPRSVRQTPDIVQYLVQFSH